MNETYSAGQHDFVPWEETKAKKAELDQADIREPKAPRDVKPGQTWTTKDSGSRANFGNGGVRDTQEGKARFDLLLPVTVPYEHQLLHRWACLMERGGRKYDDRNWEQFSDQEALDRAKASALRHHIQWTTGETDEDHAAAVLFNIMAAEYIAGVLNGSWPAMSAPDHDQVKKFVGAP